MSEKNCVVCNSLGKLIHKGTRDNPNIDVFLCEACRTKFLVSNNSVDRDYENGYMNGQNLFDDDTIQKRLNSCKEDDVRRYNATKSICKGKTVLDFGCGFGGYLTRISSVAKRACGVELGGSVPF